MKRELDTTRLDQLIFNLPRNADTVVAKSAFSIEGMAKQLAPHDTYALRQGINTEKVGEARYHVQDSTGIDKNGLGYGLYQELGFTHYISGAFIQNPFMVPSVEAERAKFVERIKRDLIR
jgi:hypothetical protein